MIILQIYGMRDSQKRTFFFDQIYNTSSLPHPVSVKKSFACQPTIFERRAAPAALNTHVNLIEGYPNQFPRDTDLNLGKTHVNLIEVINQFTCA